MAIFDGLKIPTEYDADVRITVSPETMIFIAALLGGWAIIKKKAK